MKKFIIILVALIAIVLVAYKIGIDAMDPNNTEDMIVEIKEGTRTEGILDILKGRRLIRSKLIAGAYIKLKGIKGLQAGKYQLCQAMTLDEILKKISSGEVYDETVKITFNEGKNMRWIAETIAEKTNNSEEDVFNLLKDEEYIESQINKYWFLEKDITNESIYYPLEGYLYPDTYIFENKDASVKTIFNIMLNQTDKILKKYDSEIKSSGKSVHEILTIASIVELEGSYKEAREGIASVIYNRLKANMSLGSDVTTYYAAQIDMGERNLYTAELKAENPYNTRGPGMNGKLPVGPICNPSEESIEATLSPGDTKYLYFVADSNGKIYFTNSYQEHQQVIKKLQQQGLWYNYDN